MDNAQQLIRRTELRNLRNDIEARSAQVLTVDEAKAYSKAGQHPTHFRSISAQCTRWYKLGYYMRDNGVWYNSDGTRKYCTAA